MEYVNVEMNAYVKKENFDKMMALLRDLEKNRGLPYSYVDDITTIEEKEGERSGLLFCYYTNVLKPFLDPELEIDFATALAKVSEELHLVFSDFDYYAKYYTTPDENDRNKKTLIRLKSELIVDFREIV